MQQEGAASTDITVGDDDMEYVEECSFEPIEKLQSAGINASEIQRFKEHGLHTVGSILQCTLKSLLAVKGVTEAKAQKAFEAAQKLSGSSSAMLITGTQVLEKRKQVVKITTGSTQLDSILGGGIETMSITEIFGEFRTGKTQLCHTLCVTSQLPFEMQGGNGKVAYIDTEGTFRPERVVEIAGRYGLEGPDVAENITYARYEQSNKSGDIPSARKTGAMNHEQQMRMPALLASIFSDPEKGPYRLLIVDSITSLFRVDFQGRGELSERQQRLGKHLSDLVKLAEEFNLAVVIINQVMADPGANAMFNPDAKKPIGGHVLAHASTTRLMLKKGKGELRIGKIFDSPSVPEADATFAITPHGIADSE